MLLIPAIDLKEGRGVRLCQGLACESYFYFVHSDYADPVETMVGKAVYGCEFCAASVKDNIVGVQFHPEKSGPAGLQVLANFLNNSQLCC